MAEIYANLKNLTDSIKDWKVFNEHVDMKDLVIRGSTIDNMWVRVLGDDREAIDNLYNIMDSEKRFIRFIINFSMSKRMRIFQEGRIIPEDEGYLEIVTTEDVISINEYNKLGEQVGSIMMNWKSYEVMKEYLENLKKKTCD